MVTVALLHPSPPGSEWLPFVEDLEARLHRIAGLLRGDDVELATVQPQARLPAGEEQSQAMRLRRQMEVLEKSALDIGRAPRL
jgi:hypothetical protein